MTLSTLILTAIIACGAFATVVMSYLALRVARDSAAESAVAARAAEATSRAAADTANEVQLARIRDRVVSDQARLLAIIGVVERLQIVAITATIDADPDWIENRNNLTAHLTGLEEDFPNTFAVATALGPLTAAFGSARGELRAALNAMQVRLREIDFGGQA
jgi:hypothetical protein